MGRGQGIILGFGGGAKPFSNWKLNDEHNLTVLVKGGTCFFKLQGGGGEAKFKPATVFSEVVFLLSMAWSLTSLLDVYTLTYLQKKISFCMKV